MKQKKTRKPLPTDRVSALVEEMGYECVEIKARTEQGRKVLSILIDTPDGVGVEDCETVSKHISSFLDARPEIFEARYFLEVSSPGVERPLHGPKDFLRFTGKKARLSISRQDSPKKRRLTGVIVAADNTAITLQLDDGTEEQIEIGRINKARLVFEQPSKERW
ncbi:MAG: ribosome maturation factor RimP [Synergistales bacterium]|nr:ribosome maturation factor RimP [Synergistales bacterium]